MSKPNFIPLAPWESLKDDELLARATRFHEEMAHRRTVRDFSDREVPRDVIEHCLSTAGERAQRSKSPTVAFRGGE